MSVRVITDSASDIPPSVAKELGIIVVPLTVMFGDEELLDGIDISSDQFFEKLQTSEFHPRTSQPSVAQFSKAYEEAGKNEIISIHVSEKLSGTLNSASLAAKEAPGKVELFDTRGASAWVATVAIAAAKSANEGKSLKQVTEVAQTVSDNLEAYFLLDTLEYLQKGGRIGKAQALLGGLLNIKPILHVAEGEVHPYEKVRTRAKGLAKLIETAKKSAPFKDISIMHVIADEDADFLSKSLAELSETPVSVRSVGPVIGVHTGPGVIGIVLRKA